MICIRCRESEAPQPLGFCPACSLNARLEISAGLVRLTRYLAAWAAFDEWVRERGLEQPGGPVTPA